MKRPIIHSWLWIPALCVVAVALSFLRDRPRPVGDQLLAVLEAKNNRLRTALILLDYTPADLDSVRPQKLQRGTGSLPGYPSSEFPNQHWIRWTDPSGDGDFSWRTPAKNENPIRQTLISTDPAQLAVTRALTTAGYYGDLAELALRTAHADIDHLSDEELLLAWIRADCAILGQSDDLTRATRESLLLLARNNPGPIVLFTSNNQNIYLFPQDTNPSDPPTPTSTWVTLEAYQKGNLQWIATLHLDGTPSPDHLRQIAALMANETQAEP